MKFFVVSVFVSFFAVFICSQSAWAGSPEQPQTEEARPVRQQAAQSGEGGIAAVQEAGSPVREGQLVGYEYKFPAMGTLVTILCYSDSKRSAGAAFYAAEKRVREISGVLTDYVADSETRLLTQRAVGGFAEVSPTLAHALRSSDRWYQVSDGAFDASIGNLTYLWRQHRRKAKSLARKPIGVGGGAKQVALAAPSGEQITTAIRLGGWHNVKLKESSVSFAIDDLRLDFGGIGKGMAVDAAFAAMAESGCETCLVNMSGNIRAGAAPPGRDGWRVEVAPVEQGGEPLRRVTITGVALATSGDLWQYSVVDGVRRSHILDPKTGVGVRGPVSATVFAESAEDADAAATVAVIQGSDWIEEHYRQLPIRGILRAHKSESGGVDVQTWGKLGP